MEWGRYTFFIVIMALSQTTYSMHKDSKDAAEDQQEAQASPKREKRIKYVFSAKASTSLQRRKATAVALGYPVISKKYLEPMITKYAKSVGKYKRKGSYPDNKALFKDLAVRLLAMQNARYLFNSAVQDIFTIVFRPYEKVLKTLLKALDVDHDLRTQRSWEKAVKLFFYYNHKLLVSTKEDPADVVKNIVDFIETVNGDLTQISVQYGDNVDGNTNILERVPQLVRAESAQSLDIYDNKERPEEFAVHAPEESMLKKIMNSGSGAASSAAPSA